MDINFENRSISDLITQVLNSCTIDEHKRIIEDIEFIWELPIGKRLECLLLLVLLVNSDEIELLFSCHQCSERIAIFLTQSDLSDLLSNTKDTEIFEVIIDGKKIKLRKPSGRDQRKWLKKKFNNEQEAKLEIIKSLIIFEQKKITNKFLIRFIQEFSIALNEADPLIECEIPIKCPSCEEKGIYSVNIENLALNSLKKNQIELIKEIHLLANYYGWNETEILDIPTWRRKTYVELVEREVKP